MTDTVQMTDKEQEIAKLAKQGLKVAEIAKTLDVTPGSIYQSLSKLRAAGVDIPKGKPGRPAGAKAPAKPAEAPAQNNGSAVSVEDHVAAELKTIADRKADVAKSIEALQTEQSGLNERESVLTKAQKALTPAAS